MSILRLFAVAVIFGAVSIAWMVLGGTLEYRSAELDETLSEEVDNLWGPADLVQYAPRARLAGAGRDIEPEAGDIKVLFEHHHRYRGLLWFSTYTVDFDGTYTFRLPEGRAGRAVIRFPLPDGARIFENLTVTLDGDQREVAYASDASVVIEAPAEARDCVLKVTYRTRARNSWGYHPSAVGETAHLKDFTMTASMNFEQIDYPTGSVSPVTPARIGGGKAVATWRYESVRTNQWVGVRMPKRLDAGPIAARMSFFAPVSLFFFFTVLFTVVVLKKIPLHPMHYMFVSAGFFAFHILLAYLVDIISVHAAFWICSVVSVFLVVSYMRLVAGVKFAVVYAGLAQLVYLVGFSYAFFWRGRTGLAITIGAIATLFVLMQATGRVNWAEVLKKRNSGAYPPPAPPPPTRLP